MRRVFFPVCVIWCCLVACSTPKYTYNFDYYDYGSGRKELVMEDQLVIESPLVLAEDQLSASASLDVRPDNEFAIFDSQIATKRADYREMTKAERKTFRQEIKKEIEHYARELRSGENVRSSMEAKQLDDELKLAIIFGAVGITFTVLGGINTIFWVLGIASLVVGLVFFIRWIQTQ